MDYKYTLQCDFHDFYLIMWTISESDFISRTMSNSSYYSSNIPTHTTELFGFWQIYTYVMHGS